MSGIAASVIVPTHNRSAILGRTLAALQLQDCAVAWEVVVVANACSDDTPAVARAYEDRMRIRLVEEPKPGVAAARNAGARAAAGETLIFIDDDILVEPDFVAQHVRLAHERPGCWIHGQTVNLPELDATPFGRFRRSLSPPCPRERKPFAIWHFAGQNLSMAASSFRLLGGFDERFQRAAVEDYELSMRVKQAGITVLLAPCIVGVHNDWAGSSIRDYSYRQRLYARCEYEIYRKWGEAYPRQEMIVRNWPADLRKDSMALYVRKRMKQLAGSQAVQAVAMLLCAAAEKARVPDGVLHPLYRAVVGAAIYRGFEEGLPEATRQ